VATLDFAGLLDPLQSAGKPIDLERQRSYEEQGEDSEYRGGEDGSQGFGSVGLGVRSGSLVPLASYPHVTRSNSGQGLGKRRGLP
jgi:hypothetical protein